MYGYDASGIEIDGKDFEIYSGFLRTWLKRKRLKHRAELTPVRRNKKLVARRFEVNIGVDRQSYKSGDGIALNMVHADTVVSGEYFKPASFDVIVTDAPYGVQHGSKQVDTSLTRGPLELLHTAVPEWVELLRPGGAIGISWNTYGARREAVAEVLTDNGLELPASPAYEKFQHRVDQAITRDLIVARKP
jgi:tRNA G10  N-methylase Trm11